MILTRIVARLALLTLFAGPNFAQAELALAVQPNAPKAADPNFYQDFANSLAEILGEKVTYFPERSWSNFRKSLIANDYDLLVAEPHISALLARNTTNGGLDFSPLVGAPDKVKYKVITSASSELTSLKDLHGKRVCTPVSPALAAVAFLNQYKDDPVNPPSVVGNKKGVLQSYKSMQRKRCVAMVVTDMELEKLKMSAQGELVTIFESREFPGWSLNISPVLTPERRQQISDHLLAMQADPVQELYRAISHENTGFVQQSKADVVGYNILPGVVWGW